MAEVSPFTDPTDPTDRIRSYPLLFVDDLAFPVLEQGDHEHLTKALRFAVGDQLNVGDGAGRWRPAVLVGSDGALECGEPVVEPTPSLKLTVAFAPTKRVRPEGLVQKLTELGVDEIVILRSARSVVTYDAPRTERLLRKLHLTIRESCQQSRQPFRPSLKGVVSVAEFVSSWPEAQLCDPAGEPLMQQEYPAGTPLSVAVGPEGGWSDEERTLAPLVGLPGRILRAETAVIASGVALAALRESSDRPKQVARSEIPAPFVVDGP